MRDIDKDVSTPSKAPNQWRSKEAERHRALEASGVLDATRHAQHGQAANLRKTLGVCMVALAAAGAMVAGGLLTQDAPSLPGHPSLVANAPIAAPAAEESAGQLTTARQPSMDLAELAIWNENAAAEPNRASCSAIRGTAYESESERIWFLANCSEPETVVAFLAAPELSGAIYQPAVTTLSALAGVSAGEAIASSIDWITTQQDAVYDVASESCSASEVGALWLVSCEMSLTGCSDDICSSWIAVCVSETDGVVSATSTC